MAFIVDLQGMGCGIARMHGPIFCVASDIRSGAAHGCTSGQSAHTSRVDTVTPGPGPFMSVACCTGDRADPSPAARRKTRVIQTIDALFDGALRG